MSGKLQSQRATWQEAAANKVKAGEVKPLLDFRSMIPPSPCTPAIQAKLEELGIAEYATTLAEEGYVVVPPEVTGVTSEMVDRMVGALLKRSEELIGVKYSTGRNHLAKS